jgi:hypothetical protein
MAITSKTRTFAPCPYGEGYGITLREYFAAMAMQGMAMRVKSLLDHEVAAASVRLADALLAELEKVK